MTEILDDISEAIGNTPLLRLSRFAADASAEILAKLEALRAAHRREPLLAEARSVFPRTELAAEGRIFDLPYGERRLA